MKTNIKKGKRIQYEDSLVIVYNEKNEIVEKEILDYSVYKYERRTWNEKGGYYDLDHNYKMVCIA